MAVTVTGSTTDSLTGIEGIRGSEWNDTLIGDGGSNNLIGGMGSDTIIGGGGNDTIDLTAFATWSQQGFIMGSVVRMNSLLEGRDEVTNFTAASQQTSGDMIDLSNIAHLGANTRIQAFNGPGIPGANDFTDSNVFIFGGSGMTATDVANLIAGDSDVTATTGYAIFRDAGNSGQTTIYHSADLASGGAMTALVILAGVDPTIIQQQNLIL
jgi:hypothetical protein